MTLKDRTRRTWAERRAKEQATNFSGSQASRRGKPPVEPPTRTFDYLPNITNPIIEDLRFSGFEGRYYALKGQGMPITPPAEPDWIMSTGNIHYWMDETAPLAPILTARYVTDTGPVVTTDVVLDTLAPITDVAYALLVGTKVYDFGIFFEFPERATVASIQNSIEVDDVLPNGSVYLPNPFGIPGGNWTVNPSCTWDDSLKKFAQWPHILDTDRDLFVDRNGSLFQATHLAQTFGTLPLMYERAPKAKLLNRFVYGIQTDATTITWYYRNAAGALFTGTTTFTTTVPDYVNSAGDTISFSTIVNNSQRTAMYFINDLTRTHFVNPPNDPVIRTMLAVGVTQSTNIWFTIGDTDV